MHRNPRGPIPATPRQADELRYELRLLRERSAQTREACSALAAHVQRACERSVAACERARISRLQWKAWRAGLAALQCRAAPDERVLHRCDECEAVCFSGGEAFPAARQSTAEWVVPPAIVRARLRVGSFGLQIVPTLCPRCGDARAGGEAVGSDVVTDTATSESLSVLLPLLGEISEVAASIARHSPSLDEERALDLAVQAVVGAGAREVPPEDLAALAHVLHALARELREDAAAVGHGVARGPSRRAGRFRPTLRPR